MSETKMLKEALGRKPTIIEQAGHFADRLSSLDKVEQGLLLDGEVELVLEVKKKKRSLRQEARTAGLSKEVFPGLYS